MNADPFRDAANVFARCIGMVRFASPALAYQVAQRGLPRGKRRRRSSQRANVRNVYRCPHCGGWHLGAPMR